MPRIARGHLEQGFFHVLNRGNHRQTLFHAPGEYGEFLELLTLSLSKFKVNLWGYCLMGNHWQGEKKGTGIFSVEDGKFVGLLPAGQTLRDLRVLRRNLRLRKAPIVLNVLKNL
jgi:putative transposase